MFSRNSSTNSRDNYSSRVFELSFSLSFSLWSRRRIPRCQLSRIAIVRENISKVISCFSRESWREEKRKVVNDEALIEKTSREGIWGEGMTFNAHPRGVSRLFRVNDEIKLCSKSSNGGGMKSLSAAPTPFRLFAKSKFKVFEGLLSILAPTVARREGRKLAWD